MKVRRTWLSLEEFAGIAALTYLPCLLHWVPQGSPLYTLLLLPMALLALLAFGLMLVGIAAVLTGLLR